MTEVMPPVPQLLPPPLIHHLRARSSERLFRMTGNPGNRGFGRYVRKHIATMVAREKTLAEKAITIAYLGCFLVDHLVQADRFASLMIEKRGLTEIEEHHLWEQHYGEVIARIFAELPDGDEIQPVFLRLGGYNRLPQRASRFRDHHWKRIRNWLIKFGSSATRQAMLHLDNVLASRRGAAAKARAVILGASLMADVECWLDHVPWDEAYCHIMTDLYPTIARHPQVLGRLV